MSVQEITVPEGTIIPIVDLVGVDSNAGAVMGKVAVALKGEGNPKEIVNEFYRQAMSGDYNHMLRVCMTFSGMPDDE